MKCMIRWLEITYPFALGDFVLHTSSLSRCGFTIHPPHLCIGKNSVANSIMFTEVHSDLDVDTTTREKIVSKFSCNNKIHNTQY